MTKTPSPQTRYRSRKLAAGARQVNVVLEADDAARLDRLRARYGSNAKAISEGLRLAEGANDIDLPAALRRAAAMLEANTHPVAPVTPAPAVAPTTPPTPPADPKAKAASRFAKKSDI